MNCYKTSAQLKNIAKDRLLGKNGAAILVLFLAELIGQAATFLTGMLTPVGGIPAAIITMLVSLIVSVAVGILNAGIAFFFLNAACNQPFSVNDLFYGFREQPNKCVTLSAVFAILQFVCLIPYQIVAILFLNHPGDMNWMLLMMGLRVAGLFLYLILSLPISQVFYLMLDFPGLDTKETIQKSFQLMKGHKKRLFYIEMSFLPLMFLCLFTCCIGFLWLMPYMNMTLTCFFLDLMNPKQA